MANDPSLVLALCGYTKAQKSGTGRLLKQYAGFTVFELSCPVREKLAERSVQPTVEAFVDEVHRLRDEQGSSVLARLAARRVEDSGSALAVIVGVRSYADHTYLRQRFSTSYRSVFLHSTTVLRHRRLTADPASIAKTESDFFFLDRAAGLEQIGRIIPEVDAVLVNEPGFPLSLLEQLCITVTRFAKEVGIAIEWTLPQQAWAPNTRGNNIMEMKGFSITKLPVFDGGAPDDIPISRVLKKKGELATLCIEPINYLAYVDFLANGEPRANHYHEEKLEYLYLIKGRIRGYFRRGGMPEEEPQVVDIDAGSLICVQPGWAHAYAAIEDGYAVEFSPTPYEVIRRDKVRDYVVRE